MTERSDIETGEAQFRLAEAYEDGLGVKFDISLAVTLYEKSANLGHMMAQYQLGVFYYWGIEEEGIDPNYKKAAKYYRMAAEQGYAETQCELGIMYRKGLGVPKDDKKAANWLLKAAEQGHSDVAYDLGQMYLLGEGVPANNVEAYKWFKMLPPNERAFDRVDREEITHLKEIMTDKEIEEAEALVTDWIENCMDSKHSRTTLYEA